MNDTLPATRAAVPGRGLWLALWACLLVGLSLNGILAWEHHRYVASSQRVGLPGCGAEGGCSKVLSSAYGKIAGVSVTTFAMGYYAFLAAVLLAVRPRTERLRVWLMLILPVIATIGLVTAGWAVGIMIGKLKAICPYCLGVHAANAVFFLVSGAFTQQQWQTGQARRAAEGEPALSRMPIVATCVAAVLLGVWQLVFLDFFHDKETLTIVRGEAVPFAQIKLDPREIQSVKGNPQSPNTLVMYSCFTCPRCKETYEALQAIMDQHPGQLRIDLRLNPLAAPCNPRMVGGPPMAEHKYACHLATAALAVAAVDPAAFADFANWLYAHQDSVTPYEAEIEARRRVDPTRFDEAIDAQHEAGKRVQARLADDIKLGMRIPLDSVPQVFVGKGQLTGMITRDKLDSLLSQEFNWRQPAPDAVRTEEQDR